MVCPAHSQFFLTSIAINFSCSLRTLHRQCCLGCACHRQPDAPILFLGSKENPLCDFCDTIHCLAPDTSVGHKHPETTLPGLSPVGAGPIGPCLGPSRTLDGLSNGSPLSTHTTPTPTTLCHCALFCFQDGQNNRGHGPRISARKLGDCQALPATLVGHTCQFLHSNL